MLKTDGALIPTSINSNSDQSITTSRVSLSGSSGPPSDQSASSTKPGSLNSRTTPGHANLTLTMNAVEQTISEMTNG